jgi:hypothetical protein
MPKQIFAYKNLAAYKNISHIGLGVAALNTSRVLHRHAVDVEVWPIAQSQDLADRLRQTNATHVVLSAP